MTSTQYRFFPSNPWRDVVFLWVMISCLLGILWATPLILSQSWESVGEFISGKWLLSWFSASFIALMSYLVGSCFQILDAEKQFKYFNIWKVLWNLLSLVGLVSILLGKGTGVPVVAFSSSLFIPLSIYFIALLIWLVCFKANTWEVLVPMSFCMSVAFLFCYIGFAGWGECGSIYLQNSLVALLITSSLAMIVRQRSQRTTSMWGSWFWSLALLGSVYCGAFISFSSSLLFLENSVGVARIYFNAVLVIFLWQNFFYIAKRNQNCGTVFAAINGIIIAVLSCAYFNGFVDTQSMRVWYFWTLWCLSVAGLGIMGKHSLIIKILWLLGIFSLFLTFILGGAQYDGSLKMSVLAVSLSYLQLAAMLPLIVVIIYLCSQLKLDSDCLIESSGSRLKKSRVVAVFILFVFLSATVYTSLFGIVGRDNGLILPRPTQSLSGAKFYAGEGCNVCHTQEVLLKNLPRIIQDRTHGVGAYRPTIDADISPSLGENVAHLGLASIGPDLSHLVSRLNDSLSSEQSTGAMNTRRELWLAYHLYHPRDIFWNKPWSICPSLAEEFIEYKNGQGNSNDDLFVETQEGREYPTKACRQLIQYLNSLERNELRTSDNQPLASWAKFLSLNHEDTELWNNLDFSPLSQYHAKRDLKQGEALYQAKCAACHGNDGEGDNINYPPLNGSEWISEKPKQEIVNIIKNGLTGKITVKGKEWDGIMLNPGVHSERDIDLLYLYLKDHFEIKKTSPSP